MSRSVGGIGALRTDPVGTVAEISFTLSRQMDLHWMCCSLWRYGVRTSTPTSQRRCVLASQSDLVRRLCLRQSNEEVLKYWNSY